MYAASKAFIKITFQYLIFSIRRYHVSVFGLGGGGDFVLAPLVHTTQGMAMTALQPSLKIIGWVVGGLVCVVGTGSKEGVPF